jgi:MFS transporter, FHS family, L-fucose permease
MPILQTDTISPTFTGSKKSLLFPLILVTSLFFLWGLAYGLLDVLNKHFQEALDITKQRSTLLQAAYFGAYFLMALPAGHLIRRWGYKNGIITGLVLYALGAFLFFPSASMESFPLFLFSLLVLASGLTFLETAANPYITVLGDQKTSAFRLNLSQSFNGVGSFIGPIIGAQFFFSHASDSSNLDAVQYVYLAIGMIVLIIAGLFAVTTLPEIRDRVIKAEVSVKPLFSYAHFKWAVVAQFFCVAAQVGGAALFINYCTETGSGMTNEQASYLL